MEELKNIRVREAKPRDVGLFKKLWGEYLNDPENANLLVAWDETSQAAFERVFNNIVENEEGFVFFVADKALMLVSYWEESVSFKAGKIAQILGAYVRPDARDRGIEQALLNAAKDRLESEGFGAMTIAAPSVGTWVEVAEELEFKPFMLHQVLEL
jgi:ribosomal protein S18 acetylase RimI-like enzyme